MPEGDRDNGQDRGQQQRYHLARRHRMVRGVNSHRDNDEGVEYCQVADDSKNCLLLCTHYMCGPNEFSRAAELGTGTRSRNNAVASPRRTRAPANVSVPAPASIGRDSPVSIDWSSSTDPPVRCTSAATTPPSDSFTRSPHTNSAAGTVFHTPSRWTEALSARRDLRAARVA